MAMIGQDTDRAATLLGDGELVAIPTETVYGLAANGLDEKAVLKIFTAKNRPHFDPLILHTDSLNKLDRLVKKLPRKARKLAKHFWPGPLTMLLDKEDIVPDLVTSGLSRLAIRIPDHPLALELLRKLDFPLAAPSANPFGYVSPTTAAHVQAQLGDRVSYILDGGECEIGLESTIVGFEKGRAVVHRLGGLRLETLEAIIGRVKLQLNQNDNPSAPGMISSHYAPAKPLLLGDITQLGRQYQDRRLGILSFRTLFPLSVSKEQRQLSVGGSLQEAAHNLFAALRYFDTTDVDLVIAEKVPDQGLGRAINDRLLRASTRTVSERVKGKQE